MQKQFERGRFKDSGLVGSFRHVSGSLSWQRYLAALEALADLGFLLGDVLLHFYRIGESLGDYGVIRVGPWFHPYLDALSGKLALLRTNLSALTTEVDATYVLAKAKGEEVERPAPSRNMSMRAHAAMERAVSCQGAHLPSLLQAIEELKARSMPERLPQLREDLGGACKALEAVLTSADFRAIAGKAFTELPPLDVVAPRAAAGKAFAKLPPVEMAPPSKVACIADQECLATSRLQNAEGSLPGMAEDIAPIPRAASPVILGSERGGHKNDRGAILQMCSPGASKA